MTDERKAQDDPKDTRKLHVELSEEELDQVAGGIDPLALIEQVQNNINTVLAANNQQAQAIIRTMNG